MNYFENKYNFSLNEIRFIAACLILGLEDIHSLGYNHNDLKTNNILVDNKGYIKIADFGYVTKHNYSQADYRLTPKYAAPEYILNME